MRVEDLGSGPIVQGPNTDTSLAAANPKKIRLFTFLSILQLNTQKIRFISNFAIFFSIFQILYISFWPHLNLTRTDNNNKYDYIRDPPNYEEYLTNILFFYTFNDTSNDIYIYPLAINIIGNIFFFISLVSFCLFYFKRIINFQLFLCFNFFVRFICPIYIAPLGFQTGWFILKVLRMKDLDQNDSDSKQTITIYTVLIVLNFILYAIIITMTILTNFFNSNSIMIVDTHTILFEGTFKSCLMLIPTVILFFSNVLPLFHTNLHHLAVIFHGIFCICMTIWSFWLPYGKVKMNGFVASACVTMLVSDVICFTPINSEWYRYVIVLICFAVFYFVMNFFIDLRIKSILKSTRTNKEKDKKKTEINDESTENDDYNHKSTNKSSSRSKHQVFGDPENELSEYEDMPISRILFVLRTAMITRNELFLDGKLLDLIGSKAMDDIDKVRLGCLICHFPDFQPFFFALLMSLKRARLLPFIREFQLFQLRYFESSCHPDSKIEGLEDIVRESSSLSIYLRSNWRIIEARQKRKIEKEQEEGEVEHSKLKMKSNMFSSFDRLSRLVSNCQSKWEAMISFYPNNIQIADGYTHFLIECLGDYISASEWKTVSVLLQEGKTHKFNPATVSFLRSFPHYVDQIYPKRSLMKGFDDIDNYHKIENIGSLIEMPEARMEFQRSTNTSYPISIYFFCALSVISLLFIVIFWLYGILTFSHFEHITESMHYITNIGLLSQQISKSFINAIFDYGQLESVSVVPTPDEIFDTLYANNYSDRVDSREAPSLIQFNGDYKAQLALSCEQGMGFVDFLHRSTLEQIEKGNKFQVVLNTFYDNTRLSTYYLSKNESISSTSNLQSLLISYFTYYFTMSYDYNYSFIDDTDCYHATFAGARVLERIDLISQSILENNEILLKDNDFFFSTDLYIISVVYLLISVIFVWIDFFFIIRNFQRTINSLLYFQKEAIQKASNPLITLFDETPEVDAQTNIRNFVIISMIFSTIINLVLFCLIICFHFIYAKYRYNFKSLSELIHYYSLETSQVIEVLYTVMAANTFGRIVPSVDQKYKDKLSANLEKIIKTHQKCWSYSIRGDCGVNAKRVTFINDLKNREKCPDLPNKTTHELYGCLSEESGFNLFIDLTDSLKSSITDPFILKSEIFIEYIHFALSHLYYDVSQFSNFLQTIADEKEEEYEKSINVFGAVSIVVAFFLVCLNIYIFVRIRGIFKLLFAFVSRVSPADLVTNSELMYSILGIKNLNKSVIENSGISFLVQESSNPIVFLDRAGLIEFVNRAFSSTFSYEANFIVGQPISTLIDDESSLYYLDTLKFFETRQTESKTIQCKKGNGNKISFDITFIPIHNSKEKQKLFKKNESNNFEQDESDGESEVKDTFVNRIALIFVEKTSEKNLEKKCNHMKSFTQKIMNKVYPPALNLFNEGSLKVCSVCAIKLPNNVTRDNSFTRLLVQRTHVYKMLFEKLSVFPLLVPLDVKNGIFMAVGCKKDDPTELAIECLNFAFNVIDELNALTMKHQTNVHIGTYFAAVETGGEIVVNWSGNETKKLLYSGELVERALKVLDNASLAGTICMSKKTYEFIMQHDYAFYEKEIEEEIGGSKSIFTVESNNEPSARVSFKTSSFLGDNGSENESNNSNNSSNLIEKLREELMDTNED